MLIQHSPKTSLSICDLTEPFYLWTMQAVRFDLKSRSSKTSLSVWEHLNIYTNVAISNTSFEHFQFEEVITMFGQREALHFPEEGGSKWCEFKTNFSETSFSVCAHTEPFVGGGLKLFMLIWSHVPRRQASLFEHIWISAHTCQSVCERSVEVWRMHSMYKSIDNDSVSIRPVYLRSSHFSPSKESISL